MSVPNRLGPNKIAVLRIVERLGKADVRDVRPHLTFKADALSGMLHDLCACGYLRKVSARACMEIRAGGGRGSNRWVYEPTGKQPDAVLLPRAPYGSVASRVKKKRKGSGVIAPPPYRYGFLWLNAGGVAR